MTDNEPHDRDRAPRRSRGRRLLIGTAATLIVLLAAGGYAGSRSGALPQIWDWQRGAYHGPGPAATLTDLADVDQLAEAFNQHEGVPRLIVLLSPT